MQFDVSFLPDIALVFMLVFARIGTMLMLMPALGEGSISTRVRLALAVLLTLIFYPLAEPLYGVDTATGLPQVAQMLALEFAIGFFIGLGARMITYALSVAGMIIANQTGLAFAMATDPTMDGQQGAVIGSFLSLLAVTMVFATNLHYLVIAAMNDSFTMFPPGSPLPVGDMAEMATTWLRTSLPSRCASPPPSSSWVLSSTSASACSTSSCRRCRSSSLRCRLPSASAP